LQAAPATRHDVPKNAHRARINRKDLRHDDKKLTNNSRRRTDFEEKIRGVSDAQETTEFKNRYVQEKPNNKQNDRFPGQFSSTP
jgi:hypothetical protein